MQITENGWEDEEILRGCWIERMPPKEDEDEEEEVDEEVVGMKKNATRRV